MRYLEILDNVDHHDERSNDVQLAGKMQENTAYFLETDGFGAHQ